MQKSEIFVRFVGVGVSCTNGNLLHAMAGVNWSWDRWIHEVHCVGNNSLQTVEIEKLDFFHYLPKLCDGIQETHYPYQFIANSATKEMIQHGGPRVPPVVPQLIVPLREAMNSHNPPVIISALEVIQCLLKADPSIGPALKVYYRQLLPVMRMFISKNENLGDGVEFNQRKHVNVSDIIVETLAMMEQTGGQDAFINIKYLVPVYESYLYN